MKEIANAEEGNLFQGALAGAKKAKTTAKSAMAAAKEDMQAKIVNVFTFITGNFFTGDGIPQWLNIVAKQTDSESWTNVHGEEKSGVCGMTRDLPCLHHPAPANPVCQQRC